MKKTIMNFNGESKINEDLGHLFYQSIGKNHHLIGEIHKTELYKIGGNVEVSLLANGVEIGIEDFLKGITEHIDKLETINQREINNRAEEIVREKVNGRIATIIKKLENVGEVIDYNIDSFIDWNNKDWEDSKIKIDLS